MTGYGLGSAEAPGLKVTVELRSVNNRFADLKLRLPEFLLPLEPELRRKVLSVVKRGRVEIDMRTERTGTEPSRLSLNRPVVESVLAAWRTLRDEFGVQGEWDLATMMHVPGVFELGAAKSELDAPGQHAVDEALQAALAALDADRRREGERLSADLALRVSRMTETVGAIRVLAAALPEALHRKLSERLAQLLAQAAVDPGRLAQEAAFLADRSDVTEEIVRLNGHLEHAAALLSAGDGEPVGKRLEFLLQEIQRETNTIASKSADLGVSRHALDLKSESEKIREQVLNLE